MNPLKKLTAVIAVLVFCLLLSSSNLFNFTLPSWREGNAEVVGKVLSASADDSALQSQPSSGGEDSRSPEQTDTVSQISVLGVSYPSDTSSLTLKLMSSDVSSVLSSLSSFSNLTHLTIPEDAGNPSSFTADDFKDIIHSIKSQAFKNLDKLIADNSIDLDMLDALDKVFAFAKSFVKVEYKSYGGELGYFEFDKVYVDDRQRKSLQITTLIHELTHFLVNEILVHVTCKILNTDKNRHIESVITYILSHSTFNSLVDEYAAHTVEGRFTIFGYQDYSSFLTIQKEMDTEEADIAKVIGNSFAIYIKDLLEGFIDWDLREEIKEQFLSDTLEQPDYRQLALENCSKLSDEGFMKAIWLILTEGLQNADEEVIKSYLNEFEN